MADAWAQFQDASPTSNRSNAVVGAGMSEPQTGQGDAWDRFQDAPAPKGGLGRNFMAGVNSAVADTIGAPVDVMNWAMHHNPVGMAINAASRALGYRNVDPYEVATEAAQAKRPIGGSESIKSAMGLIGANPDDYRRVRPARSLPDLLVLAP